MSDLLLFVPGDDTGTTLETAAAGALAGVRASPARPLGVYWEIGDGPLAAPPRDSLVWANIEVQPARIGAIRRVVARLHLASLPSAVKLRWRTKLTPSGSIILRLPPNARGRYMVKLSIDGVGDSERAVILEDR